MNRTLKVAFPHVYCELGFTTPLELSVATILSAQCTDVLHQPGHPGTVRAVPDARAYAEADRTELEELIRSTGFYRNKANSIIGLGQALVSRFDGRGAGQAGGPGDAARVRAQDRQRGARQRIRCSRDHRRHPLRAAHVRRWRWTGKPTR